MPSNCDSGAPAAKVLMKVPCPDSLVEVRVSPPGSSFEVQVAPGREAITLQIRPGSGSFVEVRISPPARGRAFDSLARPAAISSNIRPAEGAASEQSAVDAQSPELPASNAAALELPGLAAGGQSPTAARGIIGAKAAPPEVASFSGGVFARLADEAENSPAIFRLKEDCSESPGPSFLENFSSSDAYARYDPEEAAEDEDFNPDFDSRAPDKIKGGFRPAKVERPNPLSNAAIMALARLSAIVEQEKAETAEPGPAHKLPPADTTVMLQMYEEISSFNTADDMMAIALPEDEEMEIGPMDDELLLDPLDLGVFEDINLEMSPPPNKPKSKGMPRAKALAPAVPGKPIIPGPGPF